MKMTPAEVQAVEAAFETAQARTDAPMLGVLARSSSDYTVPPLLWSGLLALAAPWPLIVLTGLSAERIFVIQIVVCLAALVLFSFMPMRVLLTPASARRANAHRAALVQFGVRGLDRALARNGVLIYVSLAERYARVVADEAACKFISAAQWQELVDVLIADLRAKGAAQALESAAAHCAALLEPSFPAREEAPKHHHGFHLI